jgi:hypothetical protein
MTEERDRMKRERNGQTLDWAINALPPPIFGKK